MNTNNKSKLYPEHEDLLTAVEINAQAEVRKKMRDQMQEMLANNKNFKKRMISYSICLIEATESWNQIVHKASANTREFKLIMELMERQKKTLKEVQNAR